MLFSRIVDSRPPALLAMPNSVIAITATGIDALTVNPTFSTRYSDEAPKIMPRIVPMTSARQVSSGNCADAGMYGWTAGGLGS